MKISYQWLKDYVDIKLGPEELAGKLTMAGLEATSIEKMGGDSIMEFEITPNRPDCLSVIGIAREVAAITGKKLKNLDTKLKTHSLKPKLKIKINDKTLCPRYTARIIENVKVDPSPRWLAEKIEKMGLRPVNNVVDITNFVLFETGQPLHAFDFEKIEGGEIVVRRAKKDEKITTIDGEERLLSEEVLVIADSRRPVALGGVMGSSNSEVTAATRTVLIESAYFNPVSVRRTARKLGISSESSYRFERSVDLGTVVNASNRAAHLIVQVCGGKVGPIKDTLKPAAKKEKRITVSINRLKAVLGLEITTASVKKILTLLGLKLKRASNDKLQVAPPSFRQDLKSEIDLVEEVARIYGYDKLPSTIPAVVGHAQRYEFERIVNNSAREILVSLGLDEIITYALIPRAAGENLSVDSKRLISIKNPLSLEQEIMRPSLLLGLLETISRNLNKREKNQKIFELGKIYFKDGDDFKEEENLAIGILGKPANFWRGRAVVDFFDMKGIAETLFERLGITDINFSPLSDGLFSDGAALLVGMEPVGFIGKPKKELLQSFDIDEEMYICAIELAKVAPFAKLDRRFKEIAKYPSAKRDLSIIVDANIPSGEIAALIKNVGGDLVKKVDLFDQYTGKQIPAGKKGLSYSIEYQAEYKTLTDEEVNSLHREIRDALASKLNAQIR